MSGLTFLLVSFFYIWFFIRRVDFFFIGDLEKPFLMPIEGNIKIIVLRALTYLLPSKMCSRFLAVALLLLDE